MSKKRPKLESVRIVRAKGGGPLRTIVAAVVGKPTGNFNSLKAGRTFGWESIAERQFMWICEVRWEVRNFLAQPFRFEFLMSDGSILHYLPDFELSFEGGEIEIVEIKKTEKDLKRDPLYGFKLWLARSVCRLRDWKFRVVVAEKEFAEGHALANAQQIRMDRFTAVTAEDYLRLGEAAWRCGDAMTWGDAVAALSRTDDPWSPNGVARLRALIVRRHVRVDIDLRITQRTSVVLTEEAAIQTSK
ncbi:hypothetical protein JQ617_29210 [Bradyrhizobium sp. KB893862 SZCCT0404]|uniref:hypothetical protein n=1 Tax=Bradyrhizobium sp. KB893862 SZCCT0404 TaxID=2807672 RepID=UPI001BAA91C9|nr:hypothetical protein [Bradyrhizobium sp. KB893862 SZCCT0404]MBR1178071.1 hypothetical protein [Bradyrhizobium sp. KB893862 SZCCT0404]